MMGGEDKTEQKGGRREGRQEWKETRDTTRSKKKNKMNQNKDLAQASIAESQWFKVPGYRPF